MKYAKNKDKEVSLNSWKKMTGKYLDELIDQVLIGSHFQLME